jgi:phospholipid/cholesterol/gamma-HCH transport system permease protein
MDAKSTNTASRFQWFPVTRRALGWAWNQSTDSLTLIGTSIQNAGAQIRFALAGRVSKSSLVSQVAFVGVDCMPIALVMTTMTGIILAMQLVGEMARQGVGDYIGSLIALAMVREFAPIMTGFSVTAMAGSAFAAELSTMKINKQVDALRVLKVHPIRYLMLPRVTAAVIAMPLMTVITCIAGVMGGYVISNLLEGIPLHAYMESVWHQVSLKDIAIMLAKSSLFGFTIALFSATIGLNVRGGSKEVGKATTESVVWSFVMMAIQDFVITYAFYGGQS